MVNVMSRKVLDSNVGGADVDLIFDSIISQNPQLNARIDEVHNESNVFLCKVLRVYSYEDKALVQILDTGKNVFCRLSHEVLGGGMCIDYLPEGLEKYDNAYLVGKKYIKPFDDLYGILIKVRWKNLTNENVLLGYVNIFDKVNLKSSNDDGEISIKSGSSIISVDNERINIMTPSLFINGLPFNEPELNNYYDKNEMNVILNSLTDDEIPLEEIPTEWQTLTKNEKFKDINENTKIEYQRRKNIVQIKGQMELIENSDEETEILIGILPLGFRPPSDIYYTLSGKQKNDNSINYTWVCCIRQNGEIYCMHLMNNDEDVIPYAGNQFNFNNNVVFMV